MDFRPLLGAIPHRMKGKQMAKSKINVAVDATVVSRIAGLQEQINSESKNASAANTLRNQAVMSLYHSVIAETLRLPMSKTGKPTAATADAFKAAFKEASVKDGTAKRYWDTTSAAVQKLMKTKALPSQATAEAVEDFFNSKEITSQGKLRAWAGLERNDYSIPEMCANLVTAKPNARTGKRNVSDRTLEEVQRIANAAKIMIDRAVLEVKYQEEAWKTAEAEKRDFLTVLREMTGLDAVSGEGDE